MLRWKILGFNNSAHEWQRLRVLTDEQRHALRDEWYRLCNLATRKLLTVTDRQKWRALRPAIKRLDYLEKHE